MQTGSQNVGTTFSLSHVGLEELAQQLRRDMRAFVKTLVADLGNPADLKNMTKTIAAENRIMMLVNNTRASKFAPSVKVLLAEVDRQMDVNAGAPTHLSLAALPCFKERDRGTINIGSVLSFYARSSTTAYSGTKGYMLFTLSLQQEVGCDVFVKLVLPATTATEIGTWRGNEGVGSGHDHDSRRLS